MRCSSEQKRWCKVAFYASLNTTFEFENVNLNIEFFLHILIIPHFRSASTFAKHY